MAYVPLQFQKYPAMERLDLTQGQLDFKFTPIDNPPQRPHNPAHDWSKSTDQLQIRQQLQESIRRAIAVQHSQQAYHVPGKQPSPSMTPDMRQNPFEYKNGGTGHSPLKFNEQMQPRLGELGFGHAPAALGAALRNYSSEMVGGPTGPFLHTSFLDPSHQSGSFDMNPVASSFVPSAPSEYGLDQISVSTQTMFRALATEQEAHQQTKVILENARSKLQDVEAENKKMKKQIKSLVSSVNMLGGIIKHNQAKIKAADTAVTTSNDLVEPRAKIVQEPENTAESQSILYDVLARRKVEYSESLAPTESDSVAEAGTIGGVESQADDSELFNLDLLRSPTSTNSATAALNCKLRKHFLLDSDDDTQLKKVSHTTGHDRHLIHIIPEQVKQIAMEASAISLNQMIEIDPDATPTRLSLETMANALTNGNEQSHKPTEVRLVESLALELPTSFLAKYQSQSKKSNGVGAQKEMIETPTSPRTEINAMDIDDDRLSRPSSLSSPQRPVKRPGPLESELANIQPPPMHFSSTKDSASSLAAIFSSPKSSQKVIDQSRTMKMNIIWKVTAENPVFEDEPEKIASIGVQRLPSNQDSRFWKYPVRYIEYLEKNLFRTVMIDYIPLGTTYHHVLDMIYGGAVEKIELFGPIGKATDYMTARIVFHYELAASMTASYAREHQMKIRSKPVRVWQVITQTYPKNRQLERDVYENMYTRILLVNLKSSAVDEEVKNQMRALLPLKLDWLRSSIIEISKTVDGYDLLEFTGVTAAVQAMEQLRRDPDFGGIEMDFEDDPCAEPYPFGG